MTNAKGDFAIRHEKGRSFYVKKVLKDGYEFTAKQNPIGEYLYSSGDQPFVPDQEKPVIFRVRKVGNQSFLLQNTCVDINFRTNEICKLTGWDFIRRGQASGVKPISAADEYFCDLQAKATFNTNNAIWTVILSPGNTNGGVIVSDQLFHEAPETGYQAEYTFTPEDRKPVKAKYVYIKSREPAIYTRLVIEHINANKEFFRLSGKAVTNPYGDRNLEQATDLPYEVTKQLTDEAKTSFRQNKRPSKHDLPKMVKEAKEKADKSKQKLP